MCDFGSAVDTGLWLLTLGFFGGLALVVAASLGGLALAIWRLAEQVTRDRKGR